MSPLCNKLKSSSLVSLLMAGAALLGAPAAHAGDSPFGYVYTTDTHPQGKWEIEQWVTNRHDQSSGDFDVWQLRTEVEYGVTDALQTSLYANYGRVSALHNRPDGTTGPGAFIPDDVDPNRRYSKDFFESVSNEWIYRVLSPYADPIGLAVYVEPSYGPKKRELEGKLIVQKNFLEDRLIWAANFTAALEREKFHGEWEKESELEFTTGLAYALTPNWHAGLEYRNQRGYADHGFSDDKREYSANFFGPSVRYSTSSWWLTASYQTQLHNAKGYTEDVRDEDIVGGRMFGEHHERGELRLKVGFSF